MNITEYLNKHSHLYNVTNYTQGNISLKNSTGFWFYLLLEISSLDPYLNSEFNILEIKI